MRAEGEQHQSMRAEGEQLESMRAVRVQGAEGEEGEEMGMYSGGEVVEYAGAEYSLVKYSGGEHPRAAHAGAATTGAHAGAATTGAPRLVTAARGAGGVARGGRGGEGAEEARALAKELSPLPRRQQPGKGEEQRQPEHHPVAQQDESVRQRETVGTVHGTSMRVADSREGVAGVFGASPAGPHSIQSATRWREEENGYAEGREEREEPREEPRKEGLEERDKGREQVLSREEVVSRGNCATCTWGEEEVLWGEEEVLWCDGRRPCQVVSSHPRSWESACHASDPLLPSSPLLCPPNAHTHTHTQGHTHTNKDTHTHTHTHTQHTHKERVCVDDSITNTG
jgi:hypothetical protein